MKAIVEVTICLITVLGSVKSAEVFYGIEGGNVKIDCPYQPEYNKNEKYLCRIRWMPDNALISSGKPETLVTKGRFSLYDNRSARVFTVTITELTQKDAGTYYCGIYNKINVDEYTEVEVIVNKAPKPPPNHNSCHTLKYHPFHHYCEGEHRQWTNKGLYIQQPCRLVFERIQGTSLSSRLQDHTSTWH
ncbi:CMRF35-like molecule 5 [Acipenser ruthenus]|uniref:CMRF35-like molecule 5 n=1 Tax=Acipenser ruthenus TaxID=7906 RepID=UPI0027412250|nr:CMRF35-like molecule 5 [Acipenser ruthenus]XP_058863630.1 CMRF35-like molecule 5 [Acipenser ruthenus]